ncbi:uncharacterized protein LOC107614934 [Arachis ipaensis]|uniref:uncharacterized protein LOC107614934 n=1 Tax=Arachis ipaensis TaxID=130454 RepID=UPI0007AF377C|nr:uncharacterized protein LOC107614934 [Arachis ipaensis]
MVKELKKKHRLNMLGLVETKRQLVTRFDVMKIWGNSCVEWEYMGPDGASGGLLLMWDDGFFKMRNCYKGFLRIVKEEWRGLEEVQFTDKLKALTVPLERWHRDNFGDMDKKIMKFEEEIKKIDDMVGNESYDGTVEVRRKALITCCEKWYVRKEQHWKQMSRSRHARDMDKNMRYFHNLASARRRNNRIDTLVINERLIRNQARIIKIAIREFYKGLYHQERSPMVGFRDGLVERISKEDALALEMLPSPKEVREAVWDCESSKAPGSDDYNMNFIKKCWNKIGSEFTAAVLVFFQSSRLSSDANVTWVALAPKFTGVKKIKDLRSISIVGCMYKVISKMLVRRMRDVMPGLVGETQSAFVKGRKIHDSKFTGAKEIKDLRPISMVGCVYKVISKLLVRRMRAIMPGLVGETQSVFVKGRKIHDGTLIACLVDSGSNRGRNKRQ